MKMSEVFARLAKMAQENEAYSCEYKMTSYNAHPCRVYLSGPKDQKMGHQGTGQTWEDAFKQLENDRGGGWLQLPPDEEAAIEAMKEKLKEE